MCVLTGKCQDKIRDIHLNVPLQYFVIFVACIYKNSVYCRRRV